MTVSYKQKMRKQHTLLTKWLADNDVVLFFKMQRYVAGVLDRPISDVRQHHMISTAVYNIFAHRPVFREVLNSQLRSLSHMIDVAHRGDYSFYIQNWIIRTDISTDEYAVLFDPTVRLVP